MKVNKFQKKSYLIQTNEVKGPFFPKEVEQKIVELDNHYFGNFKVLFSTAIGPIDVTNAVIRYSPYPETLMAKICEPAVRKIVEKYHHPQKGF